MNRKRTAQSAFFNLRVLIGLLAALTGVVLALLGFGTFAVRAASMKHPAQSYTANSIDPLVPAGFDCSKIRELGLDKQVNLRAGAIMIFCGEAQGGSASPAGTFSRFVQKLLQPLVYGTMDVDLITGTETFPHVTQSTTFTAGNPDNPLQIVVAYNDSRGNALGASVSTDGGNTFTRLTPSPFINNGEPVIVYNKPSQTWFTACLDGGCGGLGGYKSTTPWDPNSWTHYCIYTGGPADRPSGWADNNPSSPFYGRMYVSWNDFGVGGGALFVRYSTDNGLTWTNSRQVTTTFIRNVQITGDLATGDVYIAGMDENSGNGCSSGCGTNRANKIYRSTDGGNTWTNTYTSPTFVGPCRSASGYFCTMYSSPAYWRHMGWGEPAALNGVVHLVYAQHGTGGDPGDVYYIRSTDGGVTFGTPFKLNTDATTRAQWQPSLSAGTDGSLFATWYDERETDSCTKGNPAVPCYRKWGRKSTDNGLSWLADMPFSDVVSPLPDQVDPGIVAIYAGDYDYGSSVLNQHLHAWVDGRVTINGVSQQDAFFDREPSGASTPTPTPTPTGCSVTSAGCGGIVVGTPPMEFTVNLSDPADPASVQGSDFMVNGTPANSAILLNGNTTIHFLFNTSPVVQGLNTMHIPACAFDCGNGCVQEFTCTFTYKPSTPTPTPTPTVTPCQITITQITGTIVPGTVDISNHCDCVTTISLPFSFTLYDQTFTSVNLSSNGNAQFLTMDTTFTNTCLPWTTHNYTIYPYWDDLYLVNSGYGIFTSISGAPPNRIFNIEWRSQYFPGTGTANFELRLYEGQTGFDVIYGTVTNGNLSATAGVQRDNTCFTQYFCNGSGGPPTGWTTRGAGTPTPTSTTTPTATPTSTPTATPTGTPRATPTARPNPTPRSRPTPPPRP